MKHIKLSGGRCSGKSYTTTKGINKGINVVNIFKEGENDERNGYKELEQW